MVSTHSLSFPLSFSLSLFGSSSLVRRRLHPRKLFLQKAEKQLEFLFHFILFLSSVSLCIPVTGKIPRLEPVK